MIGNSRVAGIATEPAQRARELENLTMHELDKAMGYAITACVPGEFTETLLPALLWALESAAAAMLAVDRHLQAVA